MQITVSVPVASCSLSPPPLLQWDAVGNVSLLDVSSATLHFSEVLLDRSVFFFSHAYLGLQIKFMLWLVFQKDLSAVDK